MKVLLTGGAGFIGSCFLWKLNEKGVKDVIVVDELGTTDKWKNLIGKSYSDYIEKDDLLPALEKGIIKTNIDVIVHLGACSSTTEKDATYLIKNNYEYSKELALWAVKNKKRFIYASSAATYGDGKKGYSDDDEITPALEPLNMYGYSKQMFDLWVLNNKLQSKFVGLKFFNVFGPNESHKEDMRSMVHKGFYQIKETGKLRLFKSYNSNYKDGEQKRDFIYVKDAVSLMWFFVEHMNKSGIFNVGTGNACTWNELAQALFAAMNVPVSIEYIEMPDTLKEKYQYFTQADLNKLRRIEYQSNFTALRESVKDYVSYLQNGSYL
ncbi:MAG: ADP-glyceromanno-heptose 6-epimerase [Candidatus Omnitrophota bacterium]